MRDPVSAWRDFLARPNDDRIKIFGVAVLTAVISSVVVSTTYVSLKPLQDAHLQAELDARMASMIDALPGMRDVMRAQGIDALETRVVDLAAGTVARGVDASNLDVQAATSDPERSVLIPPEMDIAQLKRRSKLAPVHLLERDGKVLLVVLPVSGSGYQSTLRALLALEADLRTIAALVITEQGETPGLGARIEDPSWQALWPGKTVADEDGKIVVEVVRGNATELHEIDGISGATITGNGVTNMLRYWLGEHGFGPFLSNLRQGGL